MGTRHTARRLWPLSMKLTFAILIFGCGFIFTPSEAINCYQCQSDTDPSCTEKAASRPAVPATNCSNPNELVEKWIASQGLSKYGIGKINLEDALNLAKDTAEEQGDVKNVTACAFFYATTENSVTSSVDEAAAKTREAFGDKNAKDSLTVQTWVLRDCVTLKFRKDLVEDGANRCVPVPDLKGVIKIHLCTCTKDKCNEGTSALKTLIAEAMSGQPGQLSGSNFGMFLVFIMNAIMLAMLQC